MIMNQKGKGQDNFETPDYIFNQLNAAFNFEYDAACTTLNCKCPRGFFIDKGQNGLEESWANKRIFCNPPFSQKAAWIQKAYEEVIQGFCPLCVMILPILAMDTKAWHQFIKRGGVHYEELEGRISFVDPTTGKPKNGNNSGTVIVYFKKRIKTKV